MAASVGGPLTGAALGRYEQPTFPGVAGAVLSVAALFPLAYLLGQTHSD